MPSVPRTSDTGIADGPTWVYVAEGHDWTYLYVGVTSDLHRRLRTHRATKPWWPAVYLIQAELYRSRREALAEEAGWLNSSFRPRHNVQIPAPRPHDIPNYRHFSDAWLDSVQLEPSEVG